MVLTDFRKMSEHILLECIEGLFHKVAISRRSEVPMDKTKTRSNSPLHPSGISLFSGHSQLIIFWQRRLPFKRHDIRIFRKPDTYPKGANTFIANGTELSRLLYSPGII